MDAGKRTISDIINGNRKLIIHETISEYNMMWKPAFEIDDETREFWEQDVTAGRNKRSNIEAFLSAYLQIKVQNHGYAVRAEDKVMFRRSDGPYVRAVCRF